MPYIQFLSHLPAAAKPQNVSAMENAIQIDPADIILTVGSIICFILAIQYTGVTYAWDHSQIIGSIVGFVVVLGAPAVWEAYMCERAMLILGCWGSVFCGSPPLSNSSSPVPTSRFCTTHLCISRPS